MNLIPAISNFDWSIIALYFIGVGIIGYLVGKTTKDDEDLFLAGRSLGWMPIGFSLFASNISSTNLIGLAGAAYASGIAVGNFEWMASVVLVLVAVVYLPIYLKAKITTIPEFLELRFDSRSRKYFSAITIFLSVVVDASTGLYAGSLVLKTFLPQLDIFMTCIVICIVVASYTTFGGLKAVVYTDVLQASVLIIGCTMLTYEVFSQYNFSWEAVVATLPAKHLSLIRPMDDAQLPWLGTITGVPILGFWYWATNQYIIQRALGAKNLTHARGGAMWGAVLKILPLFIMVIPGAMAVHLIPNLPNPDMVFPAMVAKFLPAGIVGVVLAGLMAATMSALDSTLNSASTLIVHDFIQPSRPALTHKQIAKYGRISTIILMTFAAFWAPMIANFGGVFSYLQQAFSILVPPVAVIFFLGVFTRMGSKQTAFFTLILGHILGTGLFLLSKFGYINFHFTITAAIATGLCALIFIILAKATGESIPAGSGLTFSKVMVIPDRSLPWYLDYRLHGALVLMVIGTVVIKFW